MRTRAEQVAAIRADQQLWRDLAADVGPQRYAEPGPMGEWSFADMAGHLAGWRRRTIERLQAGARGDPEPAPPWPPELDDDGGAGTDGVNDWIREHHAGKTAEELVAEYDGSYDRLIAAIEGIPGDLLTDPDAFPWTGGPVVEADFTRHLHDEHIAAVRAWLDR